MDDRQKRYASTKKGKDALTRARNRYDEENAEKRKKQKRDYMRKRREEDPGYCKWSK